MWSLWMNCLCLVRLKVISQGSCCIDCCEHVQCTSNLCVNQKKVRERSRYELHVLHQVAAITTCTHNAERRKQITMLILVF